MERVFSRLKKKSKFSSPKDLGMAADLQTIAMSSKEEVGPELRLILVLLRLAQFLKKGPRQIDDVLYDLDASFPWKGSDSKKILKRLEVLKAISIEDEQVKLGDYRSKLPSSVW